jgi:hypothetical protein
MSSQVENDLDLFARVQNGKIIEFPVYRLHIRNRAHPIEWYTRCEVLAKAELPRFHRHETKVEYVDGKVIVSYPVVEIPLGELLASLIVHSEDPIHDPMQEVVAKPITEIDAETVQHIYNKVSDYIHARLDDFARTRGYNSLDSLIGKYTGSAIPQFAAEANRAHYLLDTAWANLLQYFQQITTGAVPVPTSLQDIESRMPALTWEDAPAEGE